jgi:hypothetical protein
MMRRRIANPMMRGGFAGQILTLDAATGNHLSARLAVQRQVIGIIYLSRRLILGSATPILRRNHASLAPFRLDFR